MGLTLTNPRVLWATMATVMLAGVLALASPARESVDIPIVGDIVDAVSVSVADAHGQEVCTTKWRRSSYHSRVYVSYTECRTSYDHPHRDVDAAVTVATTAAGLACGPACLGGALFVAAIYLAIPHPADPSPPCVPPPSNPGCTR